MLPKSAPPQSIPSVCPICDLETTAKYCESCGTKQGRKATTFKSLAREMFIDVIAMGNSGCGTLLQLFLRPHRVIEFYHAGHRRYYQGPVRIMFYALSIAALHLLVDSNILGMRTDIETVSPQILFFAILLPLLSLVSYIAFIRHRESFAKHLISVSYIVSCMFILMSLIRGLVWLLNAESEMYGDYYFLIFILFIFIWNARVFTFPNRLGRVFANLILQVLILVSVLLVVNLVTEALFDLTIIMPLSE